MDTVHGEARLRRPLMIAAAGVLVVAAALGLNHFLFNDQGTETSRDATAPQAGADGASAPAGDVSGAERPSFDVVRVNPQGDAVMAGRAAPGSTVTVLDGERVVGKVRADENGEWVFVPEEELPPGERRLTLRVEDASGNAIGSEDTVVLIVPQAGKDIAGRPAGSGSQALALRLGPGGSQATVLQAPSSATEAPPVSIQAVDYGQGGSATVSGRAAPGATVQLYLDNALAGRTQAGADGAWRMAIETPPDAQAFGLRADEVSEQGRVTARVAVPFTRGAGGMEPGPAVTSIVVQQGTNLWRIARRTMGSGVAYTAIYEANKAQILDPNLIYPGQVFSVPPSN
ncbi:MAG: Ig-like domain-containing protein [Rhodospirillales bacterium]|nr:Ig-like domain-containing protein [Rhodospirillales bacterium]